MKTFALTLLVLVQLCASARHKLSLGKQLALDIEKANQEIASTPDDDLSTLLSEAGNTCGGNFLEQLKRPAGHEIVSFNFENIMEPLKEFLKTNKEEIHKLKAEIKEVKSQLKIQYERKEEKQQEVRAAVADVGQIMNVIETTCTEEFGEWPSEIETSNGIEKCRAVACGFESDEDEMYEQSRFQATMKRLHGNLFKERDFAAMTSECSKIFVKTWPTELDYDYDSSWCPNLCILMGRTANEDPKVTGMSVEVSQLEIEITRIQETLSLKETSYKSAKQDRKQCKKLESEVGKFVKTMTHLNEEYQETATNRQVVQFKLSKAKKKLRLFEKELVKQQEDMKQAQQQLDSANVEERRLIDILEDEKRKEQYWEEKVIKKNEQARLAEEDYQALAEANEQFLIFKSRLSFALIKMYILYEITIMQPIEKLLVSTTELQNVFVEPSLLPGTDSDDTAKGANEVKMTEEITNLLVDLKSKCEVSWMPAFRKIPLVNHRLVLPSETARTGRNVSYLRTETATLMEEMPEDVSDIIFPDGFLPGEPEGLPDLCSNLIVQQGGDQAVDDVLEVVEKRRQVVIEALIQILSLSIKKIEEQSWTEISTTDNSDRFEPDGLGRFAVIYGKTSFYQNYAKMWGHREGGGVQYFLMLEAQLHYLFLIARRRQIVHQEDQIAFQAELDKIVDGKMRLIDELQRAVENTDISLQAKRAVQLLLASATQDHLDQSQVKDDIETEFAETKIAVQNAYDAAIDKHKEVAGSETSLLSLAMRARTAAPKIDLHDHSDAKMWRRKTLELRAEIDKIRREAVFLPPF